MPVWFKESAKLDGYIRIFDGRLGPHPCGTFGERDKMGIEIIQPIL